MTRENQALTSEMTDIAADRDRLRSRVTEVVQSMAVLEQSRRAIEMERQDLLESYRSVLQEKRRLESELNAVGASKQKAGASVTMLHSQVAELKGIVNAQTYSESKWANERAALQQQQEQLNVALVSGQQRLDAVEADNRRLMQECHSLRQTNAMLNERVTMVMKRASASADANKILSSRLVSVERERDAMRTLVGVERQRATEMSQVAATARMAAASKDIAVQRMAMGVPSSLGTGDVGGGGIQQQQQQQKQQQQQQQQQNQQLDLSDSLGMPRDDDDDDDDDEDNENDVDDN
jgi:predicted nuclease with TOPRIM domain